MKKHINFCLLLIYVIIQGCNQKTEKNNHEGIYNLSVSDFKYEHFFFPFNESKSRTIEIIKNYDNNVKVDSSFEIFGNMDTVIGYNLYNDSSNFSFISIINKHYKSEPLYILKSPLIVLKNGRKFSILKKDFFNAIKYPEISCDTLHVSCSNIGAYNYYFQFVFINDTLRKLSKNPYIM